VSKGKGKGDALMTITAQILTFYYPPDDSINTSIYIVVYDSINHTYKVFRQLEPNEYRRHYYTDLQEKNGRIRILDSMKFDTLEDAQRIIARLWGLECDYGELNLSVC
jgi:hypothetical protein